ncbi:RecBCD enzyme subunit RecD [Betaproteobacteria bacterium]|nr:RecBCD enzyme subunit RecD [Betaproteobacteria bacterium]GHU01641.1 RecBCD enzyme subunit RecD [Betaproteobacteria bacterium]GHU23002.1 RecBCD enzyme subunit RecD [Betaproteobacteria bacterium]
MSMNSADLPSSAQAELAAGFAAHLCRWIGPGAVAELGAVARAIALAAGEGHVCVPLAELAARTKGEAQQLAQVLLDCGAAVAAPPPADSACPLVVDGEQVYLRRFFDFEVRLAAALGKLAAPLPSPALRAPSPASGRGEKVDWQQVAVELARGRRLTIISGGPGTGKTTTVARLIAELLTSQPDLRIKLAAPTGKAAARMLEALAQRTQDFPPTLRQQLPTEAHTIHRLLGAGTQAGHFRHHAGNPLVLDLLVVDEASMLDLALAARLVEALPPTARLVLLGDKDQLAAVEAGSVFADLSAGWRFSAAEAARIGGVTGVAAASLMTGEGEPKLVDSVVWLKESHRFPADSGIGRLAREINAGQGAAAFAGLGADAAVGWINDEGDKPCAATLTALAAGYAPYLDALAHSEAAAVDTRLDRAFAAFDQFRVLVAVHEGARGLSAINAVLTRHAREVLGAGTGGAFWAGRPVIVLRNDALSGLANGDIGLTLPNPADAGALRVFFPQVGGGYRAFAPQRLPECDTAFALTVHKSQGSEFNEVFLLLPATPVRVLTRELLYTGVTRAKKRVVVAGSEAVFTAACARRAERFSGLGARLRGVGT